MANKDDKKKIPVLRRGMSDPDWGKTDATPAPSKRHPYDWGIPRELQPGVPPKPAETPAQRTAKLGWRLRALVIGIVIISGLLFIMQTSISVPKATGVSMEPTLHDGDHVLVDRMAYAQVDFGLLDWAPLIDPSWRWNKPGRGDIVVFQSPIEDRELVKRIVGLPGEFVVIVDGRVYIDGDRLDEPYAVGVTECEGPCNWQIPEGEYFMLGDNRENSLDSREGWTVPLKSIDGEKVFSY